MVNRRLPGRSGYLPSVSLQESPCAIEPVGGHVEMQRRSKLRSDVERNRLNPIQQIWREILGLYQPGLNELLESVEVAEELVEGVADEGLILVERAPDIGMDFQRIEKYRPVDRYEALLVIVLLWPKFDCARSPVDHLG